MSHLAIARTGAWPAIDCRDWGEPFDAFPVEAPFQVRPDLVKLVPVDDWLRVDREWAPMVAAKQAALAGDALQPAADNVMLATPADASTERRRVAAILRAGVRLGATDAGGRLGLAGSADRMMFGAGGYRAEVAQGKVALHADRHDAVPVVRRLADAGGATALLGALATTLQEDLVLMEQGLDGAARVAVLHVSFPSAWNPAAKLGQDLLALHSPVADNALLQAAAARLGSALVTKGPFVRWVWTVTADPRWRAWPPAQAVGADTAPLHFRLERQTTLPLGEGYALFLIRIRMRPLDEALARPGRPALLRTSLASMSDAMVRYKNLGSVRQRLLAD